MFSKLNFKILLLCVTQAWKAQISGCRPYIHIPYEMIQSPKVNFAVPSTIREESVFKFEEAIYYLDIFYVEMSEFSFSWENLVSFFFAPLPSTKKTTRIGSAFLDPFSMNRSSSPFLETAQPPVSRAISSSIHYSGERSERETSKREF